MASIPVLPKRGYYSGGKYVSYRQQIVRAKRAGGAVGVEVPPEEGEPKQEYVTVQTDKGATTFTREEFERRYQQEQQQKALELARKIDEKRAAELKERQQIVTQEVGPARHIVNIPAAKEIKDATVEDVMRQTGQPVTPSEIFWQEKVLPKERIERVKEAVTRKAEKSFLFRPVPTLPKEVKERVIARKQPEFVGGFVAGQLKELREHPLKTAAIGGASFVVGATYPTLAGVKYVGTGLKVAAVGAGGLFAGTTLMEAKGLTGAERGEVFGRKATQAEAALIGGVVGAKLGQTIKRAYWMRKSTLEMAEPSDIKIVRYPKGRELSVSRGRIAVKFGDQTYQVVTKGQTVQRPDINNLYRIQAQYKFDIYKSPKEVVTAYGKAAGYASGERILYAGKVKVTGVGSQMRTVIPIKSYKYAEVGEAQRFIFTKEVWGPKGLRQLGVGVFKELPGTKVELAHGVDVLKGAYLAKEFRYPKMTSYGQPKAKPSLFSRMWLSKKGQVFITPKTQFAPTTTIQRPPTPVFGEAQLAQRAAVIAYVGKIKPLIFFPTFKTTPTISRARLPKRDIRPAMRTLPEMKISPMKRLTPDLGLASTARTRAPTMLSPVLRYAPYMRAAPTISPEIPFRPAATAITPEIPDIYPILKKRKRRKTPPLFPRYKPSFYAVDVGVYIKKAPKVVTGFGIRGMLKR